MLPLITYNNETNGSTSIQSRYTTLQYQRLTFNRIPITNPYKQFNTTQISQCFVKCQKDFLCSNMAIKSGFLPATFPDDIKECRFICQVFHVDDLMNVENGIEFFVVQEADSF